MTEMLLKAQQRMVMQGTVLNHVAQTLGGSAQTVAIVSIANELVLPFRNRASACECTRASV